MRRWGEFIGAALGFSSHADKPLKLLKATLLSFSPNHLMLTVPRRPVSLLLLCLLSLQILPSLCLSPYRSGRYILVYTLEMNFLPNRQ